MQRSIISIILTLVVVLIACTTTVDNDQSLLDEAFETNNYLLCSDISRAHWQQWCYSDIAANTSNVDVCDFMEGSFRANCIKNIAIATQDLGLCDDIRQTGAGDACYNNFARESGDESICSHIESLRMKNDCFVFLARENENYETCLFVEENQELKENCLFRATLISQTNEGCELIESRALRDACYITYAANFGSTADCEDVSSDQQETCEQAVNQ